MSKLHDDPRIDPRVAAAMGSFPVSERPDVASRDEMMAEHEAPGAGAIRELMEAFFDAMDNEEVAPSAGLRVLCLLYTSPSPRDRTRSRMPSSA